LGHPLTPEGCLYYNEKHSTCMNRKSSYYNTKCEERCPAYHALVKEEKNKQQGDDE